jgi:pimeloyl-ACP methyl ester carboxylesterase
MTVETGKLLHVNRIDLHYVEAGSGPDLRPAGLPGGNDHTELALYAQRGLHDTYHMVGVDPRGQGRSHAPSNSDLYHASHQTADLLAILDALHLRQPLLGGHSRGSRTVLEFAAAHPDRTRAMVAVCAPGLGGTRGRGERYRRQAAVLREDGLDQFLNNSRTAPRNPERRARWEKRPRAVGVEALMAQYEALARRDFVAAPARMTDFRVPVLLVTGERDHLREDCEALAAAVPAIRLAVIRNAGHAPMTENPDDYYAAVRPVLAEHAATVLS